MTVGFELHLPPSDSDVNVAKLELILPVVLAPGPAHGLRTRCRAIAPRSLQRVPHVGGHLRALSVWNSTPPLVGLFLIECILPPRQQRREESVQLDRPFTSRAPTPPPPRAPWPSRAGESYVTGRYATADRVLLCSAQLTNVIPWCCHTLPSHESRKRKSYMRRNVIPM